MLAFVHVLKIYVLNKGEAVFIPITILIVYRKLGPVHVNVGLAVGILIVTV